MYDSHLCFHLRTFGLGSIVPYHQNENQPTIFPFILTQTRINVVRLYLSQCSVYCCFCAPWHFGAVLHSHWLSSISVNICEAIRAMNLKKVSLTYSAGGFEVVKHERESLLSYKIMLKRQAALFCGFISDYGGDPGVCTPAAGARMMCCYSNYSFAPT